MSLTPSAHSGLRTASWEAYPVPLTLTSQLELCSQRWKSSKGSERKEEEWQCPVVSHLWKVQESRETQLEMSCMSGPLFKQFIYWKLSVHDGWDDTSFIHLSLLLDYLVQSTYIRNQAWHTCVLALGTSPCLAIDCFGALWSVEARGGQSPTDWSRPEWSGNGVGCGRESPSWDDTWGECL